MDKRKFIGPGRSNGKENLLPVEVLECRVHQVRCSIKVLLALAFVRASEKIILLPYLLRGIYQYCQQQVCPWEVVIVKVHRKQER